MIVQETHNHKQSLTSPVRVASPEWAWPRCERLGSSADSNTRRRRTEGRLACQVTAETVRQLQGQGRRLPEHKFFRFYDSQRERNIRTPSGVSLRPTEGVGFLSLRDCDAL